MVRAHIHFSGTVQGVGFRYKPLYPLPKHYLWPGGWKIYPMCKVEAIVEGPREKIEGLLLKLKEQFGNFIRDTHVEWLEARREFDSFDIA